MRLGVNLLVVALAAAVAAAVAVPAGAREADGASADSVAVYWVRALQRGDVPKACGVSTRIVPAGRSCRGLSAIAYACPAQGPGDPPPHVQARTAREQVKRVSVDGDRATAVFVAEARARKTRARLTLRLVNDEWLTAAVHRHGHAFDFLREGQPGPPAPSMAADRLYSQLFLSGCVKPIFG